MTVTVAATPKFTHTLASARTGRYYKDDVDNIYYCTATAAACLTRCGLSYGDRSSCTLRVEEIPAGSTITIEID